MGVNTLGDRKRFIAAIEELKKNARKFEREKVLWEDTEVLFFSCWDACQQTVRYSIHARSLWFCSISFSFSFDVLAINFRHVVVAQLTLHNTN